MKDLEKLGTDSEFVDYYDHEAYESTLNKEMYDTGVEQGKREMILKLYQEKGKTIKEISDLIDLSQSAIKQIINSSSSI